MHLCRIPRAPAPPAAAHRYWLARAIGFVHIMREVVFMKRIPVVVLCAVALMGALPNSARADRKVYDTPVDTRPVVGDDDEPFVRVAVTQSTHAAAPLVAAQERRKLLRMPAEWIANARERSVSLVRAARERVIAGR